MTYEQFFKALKDGPLKPVYLFTGPENLIKRSAVERARQALLPEGLEALNESVLDGATAFQVIEAAETLPMMCDKRLVVVNDFAPLLPGRVRAEEEQVAALTEWLGRAPESCLTLFVVRDQPDGRKKLTAELKKRAETVTFSYLDDANLLKWANRELKQQGKSIAPEACQRLTFMAGRSLTALTPELQKLAAYLCERAEIGTADVEAMVAPAPEYTAFQMIDAALEKDVTRSRALLKSLLEGGENPVGVLALIERQMRMMTHIRRLRARGEALPAIARALSLNPYAVEMAARHAARFDDASLEAGYRAAVDADYSIKSGRLRDEAALDWVMLVLNGL